MAVTKGKVSGFFPKGTSMYDEVGDVVNLNNFFL